MWHTIKLCSLFPLTAYVYYPSENHCFAAYKRGPCRQGEYLILPNNSKFSECVPNPCLHDGHVPFTGACYELDKPGPCPLSEIQNVISVDKTLKIACTKGNSAVKQPTADDCVIGGVRWTKGQCPYQ